MDNNVTPPRSALSTHAKAIAEAVFGARTREPGCHATEVDADGWVWLLCVGQDGRVMRFESMPQAHADADTSRSLRRWRDAHLVPARLTLLDGGKATTRARKARTLQVTR